MRNPTKQVLTKPDRPEDIFEGLPSGPGLAWLDSSLQAGGWGSQSLLAINPTAELKLYRGDTYLGPLGRLTKTAGRNHFFDELDRLFERGSKTAIGYLSYESTLPWLGLVGTEEPGEMPEAHFFVYDDLLRYDHRSGLFDSSELANFWSEQSAPRTDWPASPYRTSHRRTCSLDRAEYLEMVKKIKHHIREGDIYQANLTCRFAMESSLPPEHAYLKLRRLNPAPYAAFINFGDYQVLSSSPERMLKVENNRILSSPIKGTIARGTPRDEEENLARLLSSPKDRAELLMIVDLVRNDLGRVAVTGSVSVDKLFRAEMYSSLIHLISDVSADLPNNIALSTILAALLPGGSITGAPKRRAVEIIRECERTARHVYTGCIGQISKGVADFNIAIRTMVARDGRYHIHAGGGIVADSEPVAEYEEMQLKAHNLFRTLETAE